ncbi:MAG: LytTR family DNA-binding domain-containing protein [Candidatus Izemoplasmatales bacterium]|jgi:DNA-binding LytR/AlgR family response regulator|nr:LytTR family DNA-binding domain-containing protein [Candidatus Izemoplasmatales bacterium]
MKFRIAIIEDDRESAKLIQKYLERYAKENNEYFEYFMFQDGDEITSNYEAIYDILFMDIEMSRLDGMTASKKIRVFDKEVIIIFITNTPQYAIKGYEVDAMSYLLKPVPYFAFCQELSKSLEKINKRKDKYILLTTENGTVRLNTNNIYYIETMKHYLIIHSKSGVFTMKSPLKKMVEELEECPFYLCNSCFLVNLEEVTGVNGEFAIVNGAELKISRPRKKAFMEALANHFGGKL